jgi:uncharacterized protein (DUF4415 family)
MADISGLEIARPGEWDLSTGPLTVTPEMLASAASKAAAAGSALRVPVKLGHVDPRFDGEPALGWLHNFRVEGSGADSVLLADVTGMPEWLVQVGPSAYPDRSVEGWANVQAGTFEITALTLLGVTPPGMSTIRSLRDIPQALGVAASEGLVLVAASFTATRDTAPQDDTQTPAPTGDGPTDTTQEGSPAVALTDDQLTNARQRLGLAPDADEDAVMAALIAAPPPAPEAKPDTAPADPAQHEDPHAIAAKSGVMITIDTEVLAALQAQGKKAEQAYKAMQDLERDRIIAAAVWPDAKIPKFRVDHWKQAWDLDPEGTKAHLAAMPKGLVPVVASGYAGGLEDDAEAEYNALFRTQRQEG